MPIIGFEDVPGKMFEALEGAGHGRRIVIADRSLDIDTRKHETVDYRGPSSAKALYDVLRLVQREGVVTAMSPDLADHGPYALKALLAFNDQAYKLGIGAESFQELPRLSDDAEFGIGFYDLTIQNDDPNERQLYVRTADSLPYACATFIVGHSQTGE